MINPFALLNNILLAIVDIIFAWAVDADMKRSKEDMWGL